MVTYRNLRQDETLDPYDIVEALTGRKLPRPSSSLPSRSRPTSEGYDDLSDIRASAQAKQEGPKPDPQPEDLSVGCINPFALAENMVGHKIDRHSVTAVHVLQDTLQTDYEELFDMKHHSVLYAGLKLNEKECKAERLEEGEMKILNEKDLVTPDLSRLSKLGDLEEVGMKEIGNLRIKRAGIMNNKLHLILHANDVARTVCNREVTRTMNDFCLPFRREEREKESFTPPNSSWRDARDVLIMRNMRRSLVSEYNTHFDFRTRSREFHDMREFGHMRKFDDPIQGAMGNSWFVAALFSVFWSDPAMINRNTNLHHHMMRIDFEDHENRFRVKFHDKGGRNNNKTDTVEVDYNVPVNNSSEDFVYCRSSDGLAIWPSLYEKAFAKWIRGGNGDQPNKLDHSYYEEDFVDITEIYQGDPVKAMAQINGREPEYYFTSRHSANDLIGLVRMCSVNRRTICPMVAFTYATGRGMYRGCNLVANHAYSVLGWSSVGQGEKQYIIIRNPWGVTEPQGLTSYGGVLTRVEPEYWHPASLCDREGVMAIEVGAFKEYFACLGVTK
ncbi:hypothetical protein F5B22DRAFT_508277 [Xylaria bambusicola]|uniref:uncharacterized protein n=1 Tax=Xylaria bambusicola TaxID=326684 RepID=UPI0020078C36|nr:uncharacterized protein F5B22DRAFT_508277 [Xylaria bambusicola]KAI0521881.1 hypothetical protein F5B22DRAFT_508277 [Xylaria bambusicola]